MSNPGRVAAVALWLGTGALAHAAPTVTIVDSGSALGLYTSLQLNAGNPVISYYDQAAGDLKVATCVAGCMTERARWITTTVDGAGNVGRYTSLQLDGGNPVIAYNDVSGGALKLATCIAGCATLDPTWVVTTVDHGSMDTGRFPSLQLNQHNPVIAYRDVTNRDLKLATCVAGCASASPAWILTTVESTGDVGRYASMQLLDGRPVIAYFDVGQGTVKLATCLDACATANPSWSISVVDTVPGDTETQISLQLDGDRPVISYYDVANEALKLATCTAACASPSATWVTTTVDSTGAAGVYSSLRLADGRPVIAYVGLVSTCMNDFMNHFFCHEAMDLRLAACTADCATPAPTWAISSIDNTGLAGRDPSLQLSDGRVLVSYQGILNPTSLRFAWTDLADALRPSNYTGMWWNFDESGWGIDFNHQGGIVFATLFTYDASGKPMWLVMSDGERQSVDTFSGALYRATGPRFDAQPFTPIGPQNLTQVGTMTVTFAGDTAVLHYTVDRDTVDKTIRKQVFGAHAASCHPATDDRRGLRNYQDLWWNPAESGWGINLTHQGNVIFATLFTYDVDGRALWLVMSEGTRRPDGSYQGDLYRTTGPAFNALPFTPIDATNLTKVGTMQLSFGDDATRGTLTYSVNGSTVVKSIERQAFASPPPACSD